MKVNPYEKILEDLGVCGRKMGCFCPDCDCWLKVNWLKPKDGMFCPECDRKFPQTGSKDEKKSLS